MHRHSGRRSCCPHFLRDCRQRRRQISHPGLHGLITGQPQHQLGRAILHPMNHNPLIPESLIVAPCSSLKGYAVEFGAPRARRPGKVQSQLSCSTLGGKPQTQLALGADALLVYYCLVYDASSTTVRVGAASKLDCAGARYSNSPSLQGKPPSASASKLALACTVDGSGPKGQR
jgi:hypothetical protein